MADPDPSMSLDGCIVETVPDQNGQQTQDVNMGEMSMPEPFVPPAEVGGPLVPDADTTDQQGPHPMEMPTPDAAGVAGIVPPLGIEKAPESDSNKEEGWRKEERIHNLHPYAKEAEMNQNSGVASIPHDLKHDRIVSTEAVLSSDPNALAAFLRHHGNLRPSFSVHLSGTHTEQKQRTVQNTDGKGGTHTETYTETVTDFSFSIDLAPLLLTEEPVIYSVSENTPAFRGGMRMAVETGGARPIEQRTPVDSSVQSNQERAVNAARRVGRAPWFVSANPSPDLEGAYGSPPQTSSRTFEEWLEDYCRSRRVVKEFIFNKEIFTWNLDSLTNSLLSLISSTGYHGTIHVSFSHTPDKVQVYSPNFISKIFSSYLLIFLTSIILVFPFLWAWRRRWPGAGGKWETCGIAFRIKSWELISGTGPGETIESAQARLGGALMGRRLRVGGEGVLVLRGVHEADWFREWELAIRIGVKNRRRTAWLEKRTLESQVTAAGAIAANLDHL